MEHKGVILFFILKELASGLANIQTPQEFDKIVHSHTVEGDAESIKELWDVKSSKDGYVIKYIACDTIEAANDIQDKFKRLVGEWYDECNKIGTERIGNQAVVSGAFDSDAERGYSGGKHFALIYREQMDAAQEKYTTALIAELDKAEELE